MVLLFFCSTVEGLFHGGGGGGVPFSCYFIYMYIIYTRERSWRCCNRY
jgi:hypothetical protein